VAVLWHCMLLLTPLPVPQEYEALLREGFTREAAALKEQIRELQEMMRPPKCTVL